VIDHVGFEMTPAQAEDCAGFYELLGFERVEPPGGLGARSVWLARGGTSIHLVHSDRSGVPLASGGGTGGHIALVVESYEAVVGMLRAAGVEVDERAEYWGSPRCYLRDPAGNKLELMAFAPGGSA